MRLDSTWVDGVRRDAAYAVRSLARSPGFTAAAVLTLSVGIGATTAICSVVNTVLLRPLPLTDADRLVRIVEHDRPRNLPGVNYREYLDWQSRTTTLSGLAAARFHPQVDDADPGGAGAGDRRLRLAELLRGPRGQGAARAHAGLQRRRQSRCDGPGLLRVAAPLRIRSAASSASVVAFRSGTLAGRSLTVVGVMPESMETIGSPIDFYTPIAGVPNAGDDRRWRR